MLLHIRVLHQFFLHSLLHLRPLPSCIQRRNTLDILDIEAEISLLRLMNSDVELHLILQENGYAQNVLCV